MLKPTLLSLLEENIQRQEKCAKADKMITYFPNTTQPDNRIEEQQNTPSAYRYFTTGDGFRHGGHDI